jgi:Peptidase of plants and bacteria
MSTRRLLLGFGITTAAWLAGIAGCSTHPASPGGADAAGSGSGTGTADAAPSPADAAGPPDAGSPFATACAPKIEYVNSTANGDGALFDQNVPDVQAFFAAKSQQVCQALYKKASEVPVRPNLKFVVEDMDGVAYTLCGGDNCDEMHLSSGYLRDYANGGGDLGAEINGVIVHELSHVFQYNDGPGWLIEGEADFVRFRAGYIPLSNRHKGGNYDDAYQTTAFFLVWLDDKYSDFGWKMNQAKDPHDNKDWTEQVFVDLTGKDVKTQWSAYQAAI